MSGYDVFRGTVPPVDSSLSTLTALVCDLPPATLSTTTSATPAVGQAFYFLVGHSNPTAGSKDALGTRSDNSIEVAPISCP